MVQRLFHNGSIYLTGDANTKCGSHLGQALLCEDSNILQVGAYEEVRRQAKEDAEEIDLKRHFLLPAFIDSHVHISMQGDSLEKVDLEGCLSLGEIQSRISEEIKRRKLGKGDVIQVKRFTIPMLAGEKPLRQHLDACSEGGHVAVVVEARDLHSSWLSTAALEKLNVTAETKAPDGGHIQRSDDGKPSGLLQEAASVALVWNNVPKLYTTAERKQTIRNGIQSWLEQGVASVVDMAMNEDTLNLLKEIFDESNKRLPLRVACHWLIERKASTEENLAQVKRAKDVQDELESQGYSDWLRIAGIKIITDGVIDGCTAALHEPYFNGNHADPIWPLEYLQPVIALADSLDLQCAIHAIGDKAVDIALDALEFAADQNGPRERRRHRIEHLELTKPDSVPRLHKLGVTASVQAVHASPAVQDNWRNMLGNDDRCNRAYAYGDFLSQGVLVALGTDAPTAHNSALQNIYLATTRLAPEPHHAHLPPTTPQYALSLLDALNAATVSGAIAEKQEDRKGALRKGLQADFAVISVDVVREQGGQSLLKAKVEQTWVAGELVYQRR